MRVFLLSGNDASISVPATCGAVRSLEEVEGEMKGMKLGSGPHVRKMQSPQKGNGTPFMAEHLEEALTGGPSTRQRLRDSDMSAFNKLVSSMKASGTLPSHPKANKNNVSIYIYILSFRRHFYSGLLAFCMLQ